MIVFTVDLSLELIDLSVALLEQLLQLKDPDLVVLDPVLIPIQIRFQPRFLGEGLDELHLGGVELNEHFVARRLLVFIL